MYKVKRTEKTVLSMISIQVTYSPEQEALRCAISVKGHPTSSEEASASVAHSHRPLLLTLSQHCLGSVPLTLAQWRG